MLMDSLTSFFLGGYPLSLWPYVMFGLHPQETDFLLAVDEIPQEVEIEEQLII
jgi:hypothetical protein